MINSILNYLFRHIFSAIRVKIFSKMTHIRDSFTFFKCQSPNYLINCKKTGIHINAKRGKNITGKELVFIKNVRNFFFFNCFSFLIDFWKKFCKSQPCFFLGFSLLFFFFFRNKFFKSCRFFNFLFNSTNSQQRKRVSF